MSGSRFEKCCDLLVLKRLKPLFRLIWIQWNGTEDDVAEELVGMGVAKENIVIGFHPPSLRKYTEYAIG